jgi:hypothetical protein
MIQTCSQTNIPSGALGVLSMIILEFTKEAQCLFFSYMVLIEAQLKRSKEYNKNRREQN